MSEDTGAATAVLEAELGCPVCARISRREYEYADGWEGQVPDDMTTVIFPGAERGTVLVVPVRHLSGIADDPMTVSIAVKNAGEYAADYGFPPYDLAISAESGHVWVEMSERRPVTDEDRSRLTGLLGSGDSAQAWEAVVEMAVPAIGGLRGRVLRLMEGTYRQAKQGAPACHGTPSTS